MEYWSIAGIQLSAPIEYHYSTAPVLHYSRWVFSPKAARARPALLKNG
jgi:hypothetical protein